MLRVGVRTMSLNLRNLPSSRKEQVANILREAILKGDIKPGEKLKEVELSNQMGVSRGPIREAISQLEQEGYIVSYPYKGSVVANPLSDEEVSQVLIPIRITLEQHSLKKAFEGDMDKHIKTLESITNKMKTAAENNDIKEVVENNLLFHQYIVSTTNLPYLEQIWQSIINRIRFHFYKLGQNQDKEELMKDVDEHFQIIEALKEKNIDEALRLLTIHIK